MYVSITLIPAAPPCKMWGAAFYPQHGLVTGHCSVGLSNPCALSASLPALPHPHPIMPTVLASLTATPLLDPPPGTQLGAIQP